MKISNDNLLKAFNTVSNEAYVYFTEESIIPLVFKNENLKHLIGGAAIKI